MSNPENQMLVKIEGHTHIVKSKIVDSIDHEDKINQITKGLNVIENINQISGIGKFVHYESHIVQDEYLISFIKILDVKAVDEK